MSSDTKEFVIMVPVAKSVWLSEKDILEPKLDEGARKAMEAKGTISGEITKKIAGEAEIDGSTLPRAWQGTKLPELVFIRYSAQLVPHG